MRGGHTRGAQARGERGDGGSEGSFHLFKNLGPPVVPFYPFAEEGSPTKIKTIEKKYGTLILTSLLEDLGICASFPGWF